MLGNIEINKIYNCDYKNKITFIRDKSIDMILTDIPYNVSCFCCLKISGC